MLKKIVIIVCLILIGVGATVAYLAYDLRRYAERPAGPPADQLVTVPPGQGFAETLADLEAAGLIRHPLRFRLLARVGDQDRRIQAGEYLLSPAMTPKEILAHLTEGRVHLIRLTIPEGETVAQIAARAEAAGLTEGETFMAAATNPAFLKTLGLPADDAEGYLFPETYRFPRRTSAQEMIRTMVRQFREVFTAEWEARAEALGMSVHEVVTLASIIEKETGAPAERPIIASVFHNRLKRNMRLQSDPTVIYGLSDFDGNLTRRHLETPTPYNTYTEGGLPPGPIANPGREALHAALYPAETRYLYFVSQNDGTHHFSKTLAEHNRAVRKYQKGDR
jgi:UPF0755 protein